MTCVLGSSWAPFNSSFSWASMNSDLSSSMDSGLERAHSHGYASSGSEARKSGNSSSKKRASRAGTRSVSTLSAAQLERKRANDREAQRAIRQRTKDHIDNLEKSITDLRHSQDANEKLVLDTRQRNRELEEENSYLRLRLNEAGITIEPAPLHGAYRSCLAGSAWQFATMLIRRNSASTRLHDARWACFASHPSSSGSRHSTAGFNLDIPKLF